MIPLESVDRLIREEAIEELKILKEDYWDDDGYGHETKQYDDTMLALDMAIQALEQEPTEKCTWIKYDYRTVCPKEHDIDNPYWRIPENRMETLKFCPYCGKEIEVEE